MNDDPGGLVDDQEVLVLVGDRQRDVLGLELLRDWLGDLDPHLLPTLQPVALRTSVAVHESCSSLEDPLGLGP
jgi:hypothetical protein